MADMVKSRVLWEEVKKLLWFAVRAYGNGSAGKIDICLCVVCPSVPKTPPSVWKLEGWKFVYRLLSLLKKKLPTGFLNFC